MIEIDKSLVKRWQDISGRSEKYAPQKIDINCTNNDCQRSLVNLGLTWTNDSDFSLTRVECANCGERLRFFLIDPPASTQPEDIEKSRILIIPPQSVKIDFSQGIQELSPQFIKVYKQAGEAEFLKLDELSGMGYRKALEFIIKDYLISIHPSDAELIKKEYLKPCIVNRIVDHNIKSCAERAAWLGNDETHYIRKWANPDIENLKILLKLTVGFIENDLLAKKFRGMMPEKSNSGT